MQIHVDSKINHTYLTSLNYFWAQKWKFIYSI